MKVILNETEDLVYVKGLSCYDNNVYQLKRPLLGQTHIKIVYHENGDYYDVCFGIVYNGEFIPHGDGWADTVDEEFSSDYKSYTYTIEWDE